MKKILYLAYLLIFWGIFSQKVEAQCPNDNDHWATYSAPVIEVGNNSLPYDSISTLVWGGEYITVTGMKAGYTYWITTCSDNAFDSEITIYKLGSSIPAAYNDDFKGCGTSSLILFTPTTDGTYQILVDEYSCSHNTTSIELKVYLFEKTIPPVTIPVVVHIVYNTSSQNISDYQVQTQIDALNKHFSRSNYSSLAATPSRFRGFSKQTPFRFCLAQQDPFGKPTSGITRTYTSVSDFGINSNIKYSALGGKDAWPTDKYLNIWVCNLAGGALGFATFPWQYSSAPDEDGVVIHYKAFGTTGNLHPTYNKGITTVHEVGHWLGLKHIWGDDGTTCTNDDFVDDTPLQGGSTDACPTTPPTSCNNVALGGDMYVNYMDYSPDACLSMFTYLQHTRMLSFFVNVQERLALTESSGCMQPSNIQKEGGSFIVYPNPVEDYLYIKGIRKLEAIKIVNLLGENIQPQKIDILSPYEWKVSLTNLPDGIYFIMIYDNDQNLLKATKFVKH